MEAVPVLLRPQGLLLALSGGSVPEETLASAADSPGVLGASVSLRVPRHRSRCGWRPLAHDPSAGHTFEGVLPYLSDDSEGKHGGPQTAEDARLFLTVSPWVEKHLCGYSGSCRRMQTGDFLDTRRAGKMRADEGAVADAQPPEAEEDGGKLAFYQFWSRGCRRRTSPSGRTAGAAVSRSREPQCSLLGICTPRFRRSRRVGSGAVDGCSADCARGLAEPCSLPVRRRSPANTGGAELDVTTDSAAAGWEF